MTLIRLSVAERVSRCMRGNRSKATKPELIVRRTLHKMGYRFLTNWSGLPGTPDLVFSKRKKVIFVHGCFWHQHPDSKCTLSKMPRSRPGYWVPKLARNRERDSENVEAIRALGWHPVIVWECQLNNEATLAKEIPAFLGPKRLPD